MNDSLRVWISLGWLLVKLAIVVTLSMETAEVVVMAYQQF